MFVKLNDTSKKWIVFLADANDTATGLTGLSPAMRLSKNGAAFGAGGGTFAELEGGFYAYTPAAGDVDTLGAIARRVIATGAVTEVAIDQVIAVDHYDAAGFGLSRVDAAVSTRSSHTAANVRTEMDANSTKLANLDAAVSTRSSHTAADVWAVGTRTLTGFGTLVADIATAVWGAATRTLSAFAFTVDTNANATETTIAAGTAAIYARTDVATSTRSSHSVADIWAAGTRSLTTFGTLVADIATAVWAAGARTLTAFGFSTGASAADVADAVWDEAMGDHVSAGSTGVKLNGAAASAASVDGKLTTARATFLDRLDIDPPDVPVIVVPGAPADLALCRVYGYLETLDNLPAANVEIAFVLVSATPTKSERLISGRGVKIKTDSLGRIKNAAGDPWLDLQRNDNLTPSGSKYLVSCKELLMVNVEITLAAATFDLASIVP